MIIKAKICHICKHFTNIIVLQFLLAKKIKEIYMIFMLSTFHRTCKISFAKLGLACGKIIHFYLVHFYIIINRINLYIFYISAELSKTYLPIGRDGLPIKKIFFDSCCNKLRTSIKLYHLIHWYSLLEIYS